MAGEEVENVVDKAINATSKKWSWIPLVVGLFAGILTPVAPIIQEFIKQDMERKVFDATYNDKKKLMDAQSKQLRLQERYMEKIQVLEEKERLLREQAERMDKQRAEMDEMKEGYEARITSLKRAELKCVQRERQEERKQQTHEKTKEARNRRLEPYISHTCGTNYFNRQTKAEDGLAKCEGGSRAVFAEGTPNEKVFEVTDSTRVRIKEHHVSLKSACGLAILNTVATYDKARKKCENYQASLLKQKGLTDSDIQTLRLRALSDIFKKLEY